MKCQCGHVKNKHIPLTDFLSFHDKRLRQYRRAKKQFICNVYDRTVDLGSFKMKECRCLCNQFEARTRKLGE